MPVLLLEKDPFSSAALAVAQQGVPRDGNIRRPMNGVSIREDRVFQMMLLQEHQGTLRPISLYNSSAPGGYSNVYSNFLVEAMSASFQEKAQIVETFGDNYVFFFGERPIVLSVQGSLINTLDFNWKNEWMRNYRHYLRGTRCVENRARVYLSAGDVLYAGYILSTAVSLQAASPYLAPFGFELLLTDYQDMTDNDNYVRKQEDAFVTESGVYPEFLARETSPSPRWVVDPITGVSSPEGGVAASAVEEGTLYSGLIPGLVAQAEGIDRAAAHQRMLSDASANDFGTRNAGTATIGRVGEVGARAEAEIISYPADSSP